MCRVKAYPSEEAARRAIWAMRQNGLRFADNLKPKKCEPCSAGREDIWHTVSIKPWSETKFGTGELRKRKNLKPFIS
jgi:hypothetical protein